MKQYIVTGMSCAACSARVEKAVGNVPGVESCSVSLLTNSMGVTGSADDAAIIAAVEAAGYGAALKGEDQAQGQKQKIYLKIFILSICMNINLLLNFLIICMNQ